MRFSFKFLLTNADKYVILEGMMTDKLIIRSINDMDDEIWGSLYWSNEWGWTSIEEAEKFTEEEAASFNLPLGGEWAYESAELGIFFSDNEGSKNE